MSCSMNRAYSAWNMAYYNWKLYVPVYCLQYKKYIAKYQKHLGLPKIPEYTKNTEITCNFGKRNTWVKSV